jgi:hypothetical protein
MPNPPNGQEHEALGLYWVIGQWRCPACGVVVLGSYEVVPDSARCSGTIHRAVAVPAAEAR